MSLAITHFAIGAGAMLLAQSAVRPGIRFPRSLVVASGLWALVPDLGYVVPLGDGLAASLLRGPLADAFWFHSTLDGHVPGRGTRANAGLALCFLALCAVLADAAEARADSAETREEWP